jgi:hypothetical protein
LPEFQAINSSDLTLFKIGRVPATARH